MSGTFQLDGQLFPRDPLTKRWIRERAATQGPGEGIYIELQRLEMRFGTLATAEESNFFMDKFLAGGLHTAVLPHPETGSLQTFTGVAISDYGFSFNEVDRDSYALNPRLILSGIPVAQLDWWNLQFPYRRSIQIAANDALPINYPIRFYATGTTASDIYVRSSVSGEDLRIVYQGVTELNRDLTVYNTSEIELFFPLQAAIGGAGSDTTNYHLYYGNKVYPGNALQDRNSVYNFFDGFEDGTLDKWIKNGGLDATNTTELAFQGIRSIKLLDISVGDLVNYSHVGNIDKSRISATVYVYKTSGGTNEFVEIIPKNQADLDIGTLRIEADLDIVWVNGVTNDTGANATNNVWIKFEMEINTSTDNIIIRKDDVQIYSGMLQTSGANYKTLQLSTDAAGIIVWFADNVIVREIAQNEPTITIGLEESA